MTVKALIVRTDGTKEHVDIEGDLETLQGIVHGPIEYVWVAPGVHLYCHEEGKIIGLPVNFVATTLAGLAGVDVLCGNCVFLGDGPGGEEGDLPPEWQEGRLG